MPATPNTERAGLLRPGRPFDGSATDTARRSGSEPPPPWAAVLSRFYQRLGLPLPQLSRLEGRRLPEPARQLLAHNRDMTPTLEQFHGEPLSLRVCSRECGSDVYLREVVLALAGSGQPVEYGAICIYLDRFPAPVQRLVLAEQHPFGRILQRESIAHLGWPQAFFAVVADAHISSLLELAEPPTLYGRRNVLLDERRRLLAEVIEILAPRGRPAGSMAQLSAPRTTGSLYTSL